MSNTDKKSSLSKSPSSVRRQFESRSKSGYRLRGIQGKLIESLAIAIVDGSFAPGTKLPRESELIEMYGASRTTVREVIKVLEAKGLVETRQRVGTTVQQPSRWNIFDGDVLAWLDATKMSGLLFEHLVEVRQIIEPAAARLAAGRATWREIGALSEALAAMERAGEGTGSYGDADVAFHIAVFAASQNAVLQRFAALVADFLRLAFRAMHAKITPEDVRDDIADHKRVLEAIHAGDGAAAEDAMRTVILTGKAALMRALPQPELA